LTRGENAQIERLAASVDGLRQLLEQHRDHEEAWRDQLHGELEGLRKEVRDVAQERRDHDDAQDKEIAQIKRDLNANKQVRKAGVWLVGFLFSAAGAIIAFAKWQG